MFSEYASKFLAQSQSRLSNFGLPDHTDNTSQRGGAAAEWPSRPSRGNHRSILGRGFGGNPYQPNGSRLGQLGFASRITAADDAPLFQGALPEFREDDDEEERDRDAADLFALQRSRRVAAASRMAESSEIEGEGEGEASHESVGQQERGPRRKYEGQFARGIRSSWNGTRSSGHRKPGEGSSVEPQNKSRRDAIEDDQESQSDKGKMVDVGLDSQIAEDEEYDDDDLPPASLTMESPSDSRPPAFQHFNPKARPERERLLLRRDSTQDSDFDKPHRQSTETTADELPETVPLVEGEIFKYDSFFAWIFLILMAGLVSATVLVWLNTSAPDPGKWIGDTIYTTLHSSFHMLAVDTVISVLVSLIWLAALRSYVRPLVYLILIAVPAIMFSFSIYSFVSSFQGRTHGESLQDVVLRWASMTPLAICLIWIYVAWMARRSIDQSIKILEFSSRVLGANPALLFVGLASLVLIIGWTWLWLNMFTRIFLGGHFARSLARWIIDASSWWLGVGFVLMYMWSIAVINSVSRATTGATVSQWYFHRNAVPAPTSQEIVWAAFYHAVTTIFGTICESTLVALVIRTPILVLPSRLSAVLVRVVSAWIPTSIVALTNPLTITHAAIHSQNLVTSARALSRMDFLAPGNPTMTLTPRVFRGGRAATAPLLPYRLAKLLLWATRAIMATALGFAGWVITAKQLEINLPDGLGIRGSAYAYVVGIVATFIGFSIMGAMEGILSGIVDAVVICYGSERLLAGSRAGYCMEAAQLFGDRFADEDERGLV